VQGFLAQFKQVQSRYYITLIYSLEKDFVNYHNAEKGKTYCYWKFVGDEEFDILSWQKVNGFKYFVVFL